MFCPRCLAPIDASSQECLCEICGWFGDVSEASVEQDFSSFNPMRSAIAIMQLYREQCRKELIADQMYDSGEANEQDIKIVQIALQETVKSIVEMFCTLRQHYTTCPIEKLTAEPSGAVSWPEEWSDHVYNGCDDACEYLIGQCNCGSFHTEDEQWVIDKLKLHRAVIDKSHCEKDQVPIFI